MMAAHQPQFFSIVCLCFGLLFAQVVDVRDNSYEVSSSLDLPGHRSDVRCLALSSDDMQVCWFSNCCGGGVSLVVRA